MTLVLDANVVVAACLASDDGFGVFRGESLQAPDLMWWEAGSTLHEYLWRIDADRRTPDMAGLTRHDVMRALERLRNAPIAPAPVHVPLIEAAWQVADQCGFARLYDAAYVALARLRSATLVTLDARLRASPAGSLVTIIGPADLQ